MKIVQDLGEEAFPEAAAVSAHPTDAQGNPKSVESSNPPPNEPAAPEASTPSPSATATTTSSETASTENTEKPVSSEDKAKTAVTDDKEKTVTTEARKPLKVPESVHVRITPENLKDYVGPPVYYKDRMYVRAPPPGVSTGLGYLGNGSGAVMPIEATVRLLRSLF